MENIEIYIEKNIEINNNLTPLQKAQKKYYEKMKNDPDYVKRRRERCTRYYNKIKNDDEFKAKVSEKKKEYYQRKKRNIFMDILI
jgi:hypothetical protein